MDRCGYITLTIGTYSSGGAGWILLDISITALTNPVTFSYTLSFERSRLAVGGGLISWGCSYMGTGQKNKTMSGKFIKRRYILKSDQKRGQNGTKQTGTLQMKTTSSMMSKGYRKCFPPSVERIRLPEDQEVKTHLQGWSRQFQVKSTRIYRVLKAY